MNNAWAGAYIFYGPGWLPEIIISLDTAKDLIPPTPWQKTLSVADVKNIAPFSTNDVFLYGNSMHDLERHLKVEFKITCEAQLCVLCQSRIGRMSQTIACSRNASFTHDTTAIISRHFISKPKFIC